MFAYKFSGTMVVIMGLAAASMATFSSETWGKLGISVVETPVVTTGTVIGISDKDIYRAPMVAFEAEDGRTYSFLSQFDRNVDFFDLAEGDEIEVVYDKNNPAIAQENNFWGRYGPRVIPAGFGAIIILIGVFTFTRGRKR